MRLSRARKKYMKKNLKKKLLGISLSALLLLTIVLTISLQSGLSEKFLNRDGVEWSTRRELFGKLRDIRKILFAYGTGNPEFLAAYRNYAQQIQTGGWLEIIVKPDTAVTAQDLKSYPLWIIGTPASNSLLGRMKSALPVKISTSAISVKGFPSLEDKDVYTLSIFPNPLEPTLPISVTTGRSDQGILDFLEKSSRRSMFQVGEFAVYREGQRIVLGFFEQEDNGPWTIDYKNSRSFLGNSTPVIETTHYRFEFHGVSRLTSEIRDFARTQEQRLSRLLEQLADLDVEVFSLPKIEYHLYESLEDKGLITRNTDLSHFDLNKSRIHAVFNEDMIGADFYSDSKLVFAKLIGKSKSKAMEDGVGVYFSEGWGKRGYEYWAKLFYDSANIGSLEELLDSQQYRKESYLFMRPLAGSFVAFLIDKYGLKSFLNVYKAWPKAGIPKIGLGNASLAELEKGWFDYLSSMQARDPASMSKSPRLSSKEFQKGFCYAHEGYQIYNGYLSRKSFQSLKELQSLGTDWISLSPFGYLRKATKPDYFRFSFGAGSENDESLITAASYARQLGMGVMLKPHVLMSNPHWGWPGDVKMATEKDWQTFFDRYYRWIRHYALLAEMYDMDMLCIGVELMHTTTPEHEQEWRGIIARIRRIYSGPLVYGANWWQEFEQITFWDDLDYVGLNCYYPLSQQETVTLADLKRGVESFLPAIEAVADKYKRPVLLTEIGFTSTAKNWLSPHERRRGAPVDLQDQALCYQAIFECFQGKDWFHGFYWWKWPTYPEYGGKNHSGFTPNGKLAEQVVAEWYSKDWGPGR